MTIRCGIDLGGTKIAIACLDAQHKIIYEQRIDTPQGNYEKTLAVIASLVTQAEQTLGKHLPVGIGTPGALSSKTERLKNSNSVCLNNKPIQQDLEALLQRPVRMANDANCFALSEAIDGAAQDEAVVFGVIVGTGTGAGIVVHQQIISGINRIAGEWGHNPMPWVDSKYLQNKPCYCGKNGCIETFLSGPGLEKDYATHANQPLTSRQIVENASQGDSECEEILQNYELNMAKALAHVINILDPDTIVLSGGMSNIQRLYRNVPKLWGDYVFSDHVATKLLPPKYGDASGVRGAARLWNLEELTPQ